MRYLRWLGVVLAVVLVPLGALWVALPPKATPWNLTPLVAKLEGWGVPLRAARVEFYYDDSPVFRAEGVRVLGEGGELAIYVERAALRLANGRLWRAQLAPKELEVDGATLRLVRKDGRVGVEGFAPLAENTGGWPWWLGADRLKVLKGDRLNLLLRDDDKGAEWLLEEGRIDLNRFRDTGTKGAVTATLRHLYGGKDVGSLPVVLRLHQRPESPLLEANLNLPEADAAVAADALPPVFAQLLRAKGTVEMGASIDLRDGAMSAPWVDMRLREVKILPPEYFGAPLVFGRLNLRARYTPSPTDVLELSHVDAVYAGATVLYGKGTVRGVTGANPLVALALESPSGSAQRLVDFFPDQHPKLLRTHDWLRKNLQDVRYENLRVTWVGAPKQMKHCGLYDTCGLSADARLVRAKVTFEPALPAVEGASGTLVWRGDGLDLNFGAGKLGGQALRGVNVRLRDMMHPSPTQVLVDAQAAGALEEILPALLKIDPAAKPLPLTLRGAHTTSLSLQMPLWPGARKTKLSEMGLVVDGVVTGALVRDFAPLAGLVVDNVSGSFVVRSGAVGAADVVPKTLSMTLAGLHNSSPVQATLVDALVGFGDKLQVGLDGAVDAPWAMRWLRASDHVSLSGVLGVRGQVARVGKDDWTFGLMLDGARTGVKLPALSWDKRVGVPLVGEVRGKVRDKPKALGVVLDTLRVNGRGVDVQGKVDWREGRALGQNTVKLNRLRVGAGTDVALRLAKNTLTVRGRALDLRGVDLFGDKQDTTPPPAGMVVVAELGALRAEGGDLQDVVARLQVRNASWDVDDLRAAVAGGGTMAVRRVGDKLTVRVDNLGAVLRALGAYDKLSGGLLVGDVTYDSAGVGRGVLKLEKFSLKKPPTLVKLLGLLSLQQLLSGMDSVDFDTAQLPLTLRGSTVELDKVTLVGPSMSVRLDGSYDRAAKTMNIDGKLAPAIPFNRLVSEIPLLGTLLTGSQDGLVVADFKIKGATADPNIHVRPLSVLTPGLVKDLLRGIFSGGEK